MLTVLIEDRDGLTGCRQLSGLRAQTHESSLPHRDGRRQGLGNLLCLWHGDEVQREGIEGI